MLDAKRNNGAYTECYLLPHKYELTVIDCFFSVRRETVTKDTKIYLYYSK